MSKHHNRRPPAANNNSLSINAPDRSSSGGRGQKRGQGQSRGRGNGRIDAPHRVEKPLPHHNLGTASPLENWGGHPGLGNRSYSGKAQRRFAGHPPPSGLGYRSLDPTNNLNSLDRNFERASTRVASDPRFLVPINFVKATTLTEKSMVNPSEPRTNRSNQLQTESGASVLTSLKSNNRLLVVDDAADDNVQLELEEVTRESAARWQLTFPGLAMTSGAFVDAPSCDISVQRQIVAESPSNQTKDVPYETDATEVSPGAVRTDGEVSKTTNETVPDEISLSLVNDCMISSATPVDSLTISLSQPDVPRCSGDLPLVGAVSELSFAPIAKPLQIRVHPAPSPDGLISPLDNSQSPISPVKAASHTELLRSSQDNLALGFFEDVHPAFQNPNSVSATMIDNLPLTENHYGVTQFSTEEDEDDDEEIVYVPVVVEPSYQSTSNGSHLPRIVSDPVCDDLAQPSWQSEELQSLDEKNYPIVPPKASKKALKSAARARKAERKRLSRHLARGHSKPSAGSYQQDHNTPSRLRDEDSSASDIEMGDTSSIKPTLNHKKSKLRETRRSQKHKEEMELLADYMTHTVMSGEGSDGATDEADRKILATEKDLMESKSDIVLLKAFLASMTSGGRQQDTIDDIDARAQALVDAEALNLGAWRTSSSDSDHERLPHIKDKHNAGCKKKFKASADDWNQRVPLKLSGHQGDDDWTKPNSEIPPECLSDPIFVSQRTSSESESGMMSPDRDDDDDLIDRSGTSLSNLAGSTHGQNKGKKPKREMKLDALDDELIQFIDGLQAQWSADRDRKAKKKRDKEQARLERSPKSKTERRKASKREGAEERGSTPDKDISRLNGLVRDFIMYQPDKTSFSFPPMDKRTRARFHLVANLYGMRSHSQGSGKSRHMVVERTHLTTLIGISEKEVDTVLFGIGEKEVEMAVVDRHKIKLNRKDLVDKFKNKGEKASGRHQKSKEGTLVGHGAGHIGEDNVGFKLLTKMGWSMGQSIGVASGGLQQPLMAVFKTNKGGLGMM